MSNEEMVVQIQAGRRELGEQLLKQNQGFLTVMAARYNSSAMRNRGCGDFDDLMQAAALGMLNAIPEWEPERGGFLTFASFGIMRELRALLGLSTSKQRIENADPPVSLYAALSDDSDMQLIETIADPAAVDPCEAAAERDPLTAKVIQEELNRLPEDQRTVVTAHLLNGVPLRSCLEGCSVDACRRLEEKALKRLRRSPRLIAMCDQFYHHKGVAAFQSSWSSVVEDAAIRREQLLARIDETISALSGCDTTELIELRKKLLASVESLRAAPPFEKTTALRH